MGTTTPRAAAAPGARPAGKLPWKDLGALSDRELLLGLGRLCATERETTLRILLYLVEIDRRRLYLPLGYGSLFEFCRGRLRYSESAAVRRIAVARCLRDFPRVYELLLSGRVNFSTIERLGRVMTPENADELLAEAEGCSQREVDSLVARLRPQCAIRERVRPVWVRTELLVESGPGDGSGREDLRRGEDQSGGKVEPGIELEPGCEHESGRIIGPAGTTAAVEAPTFAGRSEVAAIPAVPGDSRKVTSASGGKNLATSGQAAERQVVLEQRFKLEFGVEPEFLEKLARVRALLSSRYHGKLELGRLFEIVLDEYLGRHSPEGRHKRRAARQHAARGKGASGEGAARERAAGEGAARERAAPEKAAQQTKTAPGKRAAARKDARDAAPKKGTREKKAAHRRDLGTGPFNPNPRHIPRAVRDAVWARDGGCCTFVSPGGRRCRSRHGLEIDHIVPLARGGDNRPENLRLLCSRHNRLEAERAFGEEHMARFRGS